MAVGLFAIIDAANLGFLPVYGVKKGMDQETAALVLTAFIVGNTIFQLPIGWLADHYPKRKVMAGCAVVTALTSALIPLAFRHLPALAGAARVRRGLGGDLHGGFVGTGRALFRQ